MLSRYYGGTMQRHAIATVIIMLAVLFSAAHAVERIPGLSRKPHFPPALTQDSKADSLTGFDVLEYEITLSINQATRQLNGNVAATVLAESHLTSLPYNLVGLNVLEVLVNDVPATYTHTNGIIDISLDIPAGQTFTTQVFYSGVPQLSPAPYNLGMIFTGNTVFTISDPDAARYWWPCYDHPWDKAIVHLRITMRSDWKVAANGIREAIVENGDGTSTTFWTGYNPMTTYLVCITAGPYLEIEQTAGDIPIQNFVMQNQYNNALADFARLPQMIDYFSQVFGPYPFEKYGNAVVSMSTYGAMEHQTMTTLGNYIITGTGAHELVIAHELAHQWYGNAVSFLTFKDVWLSEGFATYSEHLWTDKVSGWQSAVDYVASSYHQYYINWEGSNPRTIYDPDFNNYFSPPSYEKAASVLHMLRLKIGDAHFFQLLQQWFSTHCNGNVVTAEFEAMAEQISGQDLTQFFHQWIYSPGIPALEYCVWNNDASDTPLRLLARTISNTSTQFEIEVPFLFDNGSCTDSLHVSAGPDWTANGGIHGWTDAASLIPNHNHWALLRQITEVKPVLAQCLPSNAFVRLEWEDFLGDGNLSYNVFRRPQGEGQAWTLLTQQSLPDPGYTDSTPQPGIAYEYCITAVDPNGWESMRSNIMAATPEQFSFANDLLVVDETRDGNGANINPTDAMVDDFYAAALAPLAFGTWDIAQSGMPPLGVLGQYKLVLWHADDFNQNLLQDNNNLLGGYLSGGGKVLLSGWKTVSVFSSSFLDSFAEGVELVYNNSPCLISAQSALYPSLVPDPGKLLGNWNGMLPYIYTFTGASRPIYTAEMPEGSAGNGNCLAFWVDYPQSSARLVLTGFPLYFMQADGVRNLLQQLVPQLLSPTAADDPSSPLLKATLTVWPNPFNPSSTISFSLPRKGNMSLRLYNLKGQLVKVLYEGIREAGEHSLSFNATSDSGTRLPSGVYLLRLSHPGGQLLRRISLIK